MISSKSSVSKGEVKEVTVEIIIYIDLKKSEIWETGNLISKNGKLN